jgi:hypothetical protein
MKKLLPLALLAALAGCATDKSSDVQAPIAGDAVKSSNPAASNPSIPAGARNAMPPVPGK